MQAVAEWLTNGWSAYGLSLAIIAWALVAFARFRRRLTPLQRELDELCQLMRGAEDAPQFAAQFSELSRRFASSTLLGHQWREFSETLIWPDPADGIEVIRNTQNGAAFFSREDLLGPHLNLRFYNALPNLLTGAGILGTFLGLVAGIHLAGKGLSDPNHAHEALQGLLSGASLAFLTSIAGLVSSIVFSSREKQLLHRFDQRRRDWIDALDARIERVTLEQVALDGLHEQKQQVTVLTQFTDQLAFQIAEAIDQRVTPAIDASIGAPLRETLDNLESAVRSLGERQASMTEEFMRSLVGEFREAVQGAAGAQMQEFAGVLQTTSDELRKSLDVLVTNQEAMQQQARESVQVLSETLSQGAQRLGDRVTESVDHILEGLKLTVDEMSSMLGRTTEAFDGSVSRLASSTGAISKVLEEARTVLAHTARIAQQLQGLQQGWGAMVAGVGEASKRFEAAGANVDAVADKLAQSASNVSAAAQAIQDAHAQMSAAWDEYERRFKELDESLGATFVRLQDGMQRSQSSIAEFVQGIDGHTAAISRHLAAAVEEIVEATQELAGETRRLRESLSTAE